jgi:putative membrane-bound dehydrogenase-like protein
MKRSLLTLLCGAALHTIARAGNATDAPAQRPEAELAGAQPAPGLSVSLVASDPVVESPCAIAFDEHGRLFVAENRGYPIGPAPGEPPVGRILLLESTKHDGNYDKSTVFAENLTFPNGVLPWGKGLLVTCAPDFLYFEDTNGDGKADVRKVLLTGFNATKSTQLRVNRPTLGPDGWIYLAAGLVVSDAITSPEHPEIPAVKMSGDLRWDPRTGNFENVDGRSQFGMSFDDYGRRFICMNRIQVQHVVLTAKDLKRNPLFAFSDSVQNCPELIPNLLMHSTGGAARVYPISSNITTADSHVGTFTAACGVYVWRGGALPPEYRGCAFSCDPTGNLVHVDKLVPRGASFSAEPLLDKKEALAFKDDWARPVFVESGPDGALYVCDMYRRVIEHPDYLSEELRKHTDFSGGKNLGRIWRITAKGATAPPPPDFGDVRKIAALVGGGEGWLSQTGFRLLAQEKVAGAPEALHAELKLERSPGGTASLLRLLALYEALTPEDLSLGFASEHPGVRETALVLAGAIPPGVAKTLGDNPRLRFEAALTPGEPDLRLLASILLRSDEDRWTEAAVLSAVPKQTLALLKLVQGNARPPKLTPAFYENAGRLIGAGKEAPDATAVAQALPNLQGLSGLVAGYCLASRAKLDPADPVIGGLLKAAAQNIAAEGSIALLSHAPWEVARDPLLAAAKDRDHPEISEAAIRALAAFDSPEVPAFFLSKERWTHASPAERQTILEALLSHPADLAGVLAAIESGNLPASAIPTVRRAVFLKNKDAALRARAEKLFAASGGDRQVAYDAAKACLALTPSATHGAQIFHNICATCHRLNRDGVAVGPDLIDMRGQTKETILFHIIIPDAEIAPAFTCYTAETKDGRTLAGILASETPTSVTLRMPLAQEETVLRTNLVNLTALTTSLMPTGLEAAMSKQDLADLLSFLKGEK